MGASEILVTCLLVISLVNSLILFRLLLRVKPCGGCNNHITKSEGTTSPSNFGGELPDICVTYLCSIFLVSGLVLFCFFCFVPGFRIVTVARL